MKFMALGLMGVLGLVSSTAFAEEAILCSELAPYYWREGDSVPRFSLQRGSVLVRLNDQGSGTATWMTNATGKVHTSGRYNVTHAGNFTPVKIPRFQKLIQNRMISTNPPSRVKVLLYAIEVEDFMRAGRPGGVLNISFENYNEAQGTTGTGFWSNAHGTQGGNFVFCTKRTR